jgi:hypothetical protein
MPARLSRFFARRPRPAAPPPADPALPPPPAPEPSARNPALLRRERRDLARRREIELRDVGGLTVEMVRRDRFRPELLVERAGDVLLLEQRVHELDSLLAAEAAVRGLRHVPRCKCGAPLPPGVHFCSHCGRAAPATPPVVTCAHCHQPLPAETNFCSFCGHPVAAAEYVGPAGDADGLDETSVRPPAAEADEDGARGG